MSRFETYKMAQNTLPETYQAWQVYGAGLENVGKNGKPVTLKLRQPEKNEVMLRMDAVGLCLSDIKIINQGSKHPRLRGRDLAVNPTVLGHECAVTVVAVGDRWKNQFKIGQRFIVQADIYYKGIGYAFGYVIPGGLEQFTYLDERALDGDEGCYLLPMKEETGYSQAALSEPWACVEMSYNLDDRTRPDEGTKLIISDNAGELKRFCPEAKVAPRSLEGIQENDVYSDIFVPNATPDIVTKAAKHLARNGILFLLGKAAAQGNVTIDIGRVHYENVRFYGGGDTIDEIARSKERHDLLPEGMSLFIGAGGPMGQMHVQRAIEMPSGPRRIVVTDLDRERLDHIEKRFGDMAKAKDIELFTLAPSQFESQQAMDAHIHSLAPDGYTDIALLAPVPALVKYAMAYAADNALINVFAGLPVGTSADLPLDGLCRGIKIMGSSGSRISDLRKILEMVEAGQLNTNLSVAAIGGLPSAREGLEAVKNAKYHGKTVIYPQVLDIPLMPLEEVPDRIPELKDKLGPGGSWTNEAERALLENYAQ